MTANIFNAAIATVPFPPVASGCNVSTWGRSVAKFDLELWADGNNALTAAKLYAGVLAPAAISDIVCASLGTPIAISAVTNGADTLTHVAHGLVVGAGPYYVHSTLTVPAGLAETTPYWIATTPDADTFTLGASLALALAGTSINLTTDGTGTITLVPVNVDVSTNIITKTAHALFTGDGPVQFATSSALPSGLALLTNYWIICISANKYALAASLSDALNGVMVPLVTTGVGNQTLSDTLATQVLHFELMDLLGTAADGAVTLTARLGYTKRYEHRPGAVSYHVSATFGTAAINTYAQVSMVG